MRIKNDTVIKSSKLADTAFLSNEEFGAIIRCVMINDDENEQRYEYLDEETAEFLKEKENEWKKDLENLKAKNPMVRMAYTSVFGQVKHSRDAFYRKQDDYNKKDGKNQTDESDETTTAGKGQNKIITEQLELPLQDGYTLLLSVEYPPNKEKNIPSIEELKELIQNYEDDENIGYKIDGIIMDGNYDKWKKNWKAYKNF